MANESNLKPITSKERARELGRKGGIASQVKYKQVKSLKECAKIFANLKPTDNVITQLENVGIGKNDASYLMAMIVGVGQRAMKGDAKALKTITELLGEDSRINLDENKFNQEIELKEKEFELRKRELELREKEFEHRMALENGEVKEEDKVIIVNNLDELAKKDGKTTKGN